MEIEEVYTPYKPLLFSIAYQMVGTISEAEDIVHDVFIKATEIKENEIENKKAYLCKMVTNKCIDYLNSARKIREVYTGPWLPEPLVSKLNDGEHQVLQDEELSFALLFLLEKLNPVERAVFILREVYQYDYEMISRVVNRSEGACRKILSRIKSKLPALPDKLNVNFTANNSIIQAFIIAMHQGDVPKIEALLREDITLYSDGGGKVFAALKPIHSMNLVLRFLMNLLKEYSGNKSSTQINLVLINGQLGVHLVESDKLETVIGFEVKDGKIEEIYIIRNPDKLKHL